MPQQNDRSCEKCTVGSDAAARQAVKCKHLPNREGFIAKGTTFCVKMASACRHYAEPEPEQSAEEAFKDWWEVARKQTPLRGRIGSINDGRQIAKASWDAGESHGQATERPKVVGKVKVMMEKDANTQINENYHLDTTRLGYWFNKLDSLVKEVE